MEAHLGCDFLDKPVSTGVSIYRLEAKLRKIDS